MRVALRASLGLLVPALAAAQGASQPRLGARSAPILQVDGLRFKDSNRSGALDPYEDWRLPAEARARDLVARMTREDAYMLVSTGCDVRVTQLVDGTMGVHVMIPKALFTR
jgi:hypothetical protein